jgi:hypothetical protein
MEKLAFSGSQNGESLIVLFDGRRRVEKLSFGEGRTSPRPAVILFQANNFF